jgi:hypothetical protein
MMGASGYTIFEDDLGADWSGDFLENPSAEKVKKILNKAKSVKYLDDLMAAAALVCAEIVAAAAGNPIGSMPDELSAWAQSVAHRLSSLKDAACNTVDVVKDRSELNEIWAGDPEWFKYLQGLRQRLDCS